MPFDYYDTNGFLAMGPTIPQWRQLRAELTGTHGAAFVNAGSTEQPLDLADEIVVADRPEPVATLLAQLKRACEQAESALFLSDGTTVEGA